MKDDNFVLPRACAADYACAGREGVEGEFSLFIGDKNEYVLA
jgi:hypothetical protein